MMEAALATVNVEGGVAGEIVQLAEQTANEMSELQDIVSIPKEVILISLVAQEHSLYNPKHENYRNTQYKDSKWLHIAHNVGWTETQCKAKWKAMRDQYCRELKRSKINAKTNVKWKYFKDLDFLRPYALSRNYRPRHSLALTTTIDSPDNYNNKYTAAGIGTIKIESGNHQYNGCDFTSNNNNNNINTTNINTTATSNDNNSNTTTVAHNSVKTESATQHTTSTTTSTLPTSAANAAATTRLLYTLTDEQLSSVLQQQQQQQHQQHVTAGTIAADNWKLLTATTTVTAASSSLAEITANNSNNSTSDIQRANGSTSLQSQQQQGHTSDDVFYSTLVDCVNSQAPSVAITVTTQQQQQQHIKDEDDEDPIHTFLNIESYFEKELIAMIQQEDILYNSYHPNYRNVKLKLEVWDEIARKLKKTVKQCRLKWKALRDQYIREHKRLKNRENAESLPRWKHYDALSFLQKFIKHKPNDFDTKNLIQIPKTDMDTNMVDEQLIDDHPHNRQHQQHQHSPLRASPMDVTSTLIAVDVAKALQQQQLPDITTTTANSNQTQMHTPLPSLTGPHTQGQQQQLEQSVNNSLCISVSNGSGAAAAVSDDDNIGVDVGDTTVDDDDDEAGAYDEMDIDNYIISDDPHDGDVGDVDGETGEPEDGTNGGNANGCIVENVDEDEEQAKLVKQQFATQYQQQQQHISNIHNNTDDEEEFVDIKSSLHSTVTQEHTLLSFNAAVADLVEESLQQRNNTSSNSNQNQQPTSSTFGDINASPQGIVGVAATGNNDGSTLLLHSLNGVNNTASTITSNAMPATNQQKFGAAATTPTATSTPTTATNGNNKCIYQQQANDDDEVGAFFKAVAMKIRNVNMSPVAFTDLQIDILRVINGSLRNH